MNVVKTKYGPIRGVVVRTEPLVEAYLGVPYASPPVGSLRFMPPVTPSTWKNTRLADRFSAVCPQSVPVPPSGPEALLEIPRGRLAQLRRFLPLLTNQSEDCLYLNIYVPRALNPGSASPPSPTNFNDDAHINMAPLQSDAGLKIRNGNSGGGGTASETTFTNGGFSDLNDDPKNKLLPTIVYIHGESYEWNSGNPYDGSVLAAHGNVIVVTINFRLGIFGFLKTGGKGSAQGNFGLMDLVAGLHWLRENLPAFGGDPNRVTIMGHGTGAALANILIVSPVASDLIHRAMLLSGSALSPWAIQKDPLFVKRRVAEQTGCHGDLLIDDLAPCLRTKTIEELLNVTIDSPRFLPGFAPFIDGTVIVNPSSSSSGSPLILPAGSAIASTTGIEMADFPTRELIFGVSSIESYLDLSAQDLEFGFNETRRDRILRTYVRNVYHYHLNEIYAALKNEYTDWERPIRNPLGSRDASLEFLSDGHTAAPLIRLGYLHTLRGGKTYFLHFRHQSGERDFPQRGGSVRGEDVPFCLGLPISPLFPYNYTKQDIKISRTLIRYIANFAHNGNPNDNPANDISRLTHSKLLESSSLTLGKANVRQSEKPPTTSVSKPLYTDSGITTGTVSSSASTTTNTEQSIILENTNNKNLPIIPFQSQSLRKFSSETLDFKTDYNIANRLSALGDKHNIRNLGTIKDDVTTFYLDDITTASAVIAASKKLTVSVGKKSKRNIRSNGPTTKNFRRRKRKITKHTLNKRKHKNFYSEILNTEFKINNDSKLYQKIYQIKSGNIIDFRKNLNRFDRSLNYHRISGHSKAIRHDMQNDEAEDDLGEEEDDEDEDIDEHNIESDRQDSSNENDEDDDHQIFLDKSSDDRSAYEKHDRFDSLPLSRLPFWDTYDAINQLYLDLGNKVEIRNHYRGHKLSMWLSLIPQLHSPGDLNELPMRHHHFPEDSAQYYDGIIRPQVTQKTNFPKSTNFHPSTNSFHPTSQTSIRLAEPTVSGTNVIPPTTTECPPNTTIVPTIAATRPQNHQQNGSVNSGHIPASGSASTSNTNNVKEQNLFKRLTTGQFQSYTTALIVTISVGCFLLLLNILIFAGIYYQREKRLNDAKKKEELREAERCASPPSLEKFGCSSTGLIGGTIANIKGSRKSSIQSLAAFNSGSSFGEYNCYDEKLVVQCKEKHALADICSVELPLKEFKCSSSSPNASNSGSLRRNTTSPLKQSSSGLLIYPPTYNPLLGVHKDTTNTAAEKQSTSRTCSPTSNADNLVTYSQFHKTSTSQNSSQQQHIHHQHHQHHLKHHHQLHVHTPSGSPVATTTTTSNVGTSTATDGIHCNQSTQSDEPNIQNDSKMCSTNNLSNNDEKTVIVLVSGGGNNNGLTTSGSKFLAKSKLKLSDQESSIDNDIENLNEDLDDDNIPEPPPPPKSQAPFHVGILRQPGPPTTPGSNKKRVQIQEISV